MRPSPAASKPCFQRPAGRNFGPPTPRPRQKFHGGCKKGLAARLGPRTAPRRPRMAPRQLTEHLQPPPVPQESQKLFSDLTRNPIRGQDGPKAVQHGPTAPGLPQDGPRRPQERAGRSPDSPGVPPSQPRAPLSPLPAQSPLTLLPLQDTPGLMSPSGCRVHETIAILIQMLGDTRGRSVGFTTGKPQLLFLSGGP